MLSVIIQNNQEPNVIKLTYENLLRELRSVPESELIVANDWLEGLATITNDFVCFVEADCLVSSGYFSSQLGIMRKEKQMRKIAMQTSAVGLDTWANRVYGYKIGNNYIDGVIPVKQQASKAVYPVEIGYVPGSIMRTSMLKQALGTLKLARTRDINLVRLSADISFAFWKQGDGNRVHLNPNTTYVTTDMSVGDVLEYNPKPGNLTEMFKRESI